MIDLTDATWDSAIQDDRPVLVAFWAPWCGPCRVLRPILEELASHFNGRITFARLNTDENPEICARYEISAIPHLILFRKGVVLRRLIGVQNLNSLALLLYRILE